VDEDDLDAVLNVKEIEDSVVEDGNQVHRASESE
jgi:hypothetical protein